MLNNGGRPSNQCLCCSGPTAASVMRVLFSDYLALLRGCSQMNMQNAFPLPGRPWVPICTGTLGTY